MAAAPTPPLKWHGGKHYLTPKIIALMPRHIHYVEPYAGSLKVLLARDPDDERLWQPPHRGVSELVNDLDGRLTNFWRVLQDPAKFEPFRRSVEATALSRVEWEAAHSHRPSGDAVRDAVAFFIECRQSRAANMRSFTSITRNRLRRGINGNASEWLGAVDGLPAVHARLRSVVIENRPALKVIHSEDAPGTLFYLDPPYVHETRTVTDAYACEMTERDHVEMLDVTRSLKGKVILSGYPSDLYDRALADWNRHAIDLPNNTAGGPSKARKTEVLWCNF
jgi:DNA adenine methylase